MNEPYSRLCNFLVHVIAIIALTCLWCNHPAEAADEPPGVPRFVPPAVETGEAIRPMSIRFVTTDDFPPFNFLDGSGRLTGYNVELARAICARMQVPCTIQVRRFPLLVDALVQDEADAVIAGLRDTPRLRSFVDHTQAYLRLPARFVMTRDTAVTPTPESMAGRSVAVVRNTRYDDFLRDFFPTASRIETNDLDSALKELAENRVEAVFAGGLPLVFWLAGPEGSACCAFAGGAYTEPAYFGGGLTIAVRREDEPLRRSLDDMLRALEADGVLADLYLRFFPAGLY